MMVEIEEGEVVVLSVIELFEDMMLVWDIMVDI